MNRTAIQPRLVVPPVRALVDSITQNASAALKKFERTNATLTNATLSGKEIAPETEGTAERNAMAFARPSPSSLAMDSFLTRAGTSTSSIGKGAAFAAVVVLHLLVLIVLSTISPQPKPVATEPLQVISVTTPEVEQAPSPSLLPSLQLPELSPAIEPEINIAVVESAPVGVAPRPAAVESDDVASGTPKLVSSVEYIREPVAKYPPAARALRQHGTVTLRALVDASGHAREVNVHRSSGSRILDDAGLNAVSQALFKPYSENGRAIPVYVLIPIEFGAAG